MEEETVTSYEKTEISLFFPKADPHPALTA
jgi:hypothetical protein